MIEARESGKHFLILQLLKITKQFEKKKRNIFYEKARIKSNERVHIVDEATRNRRQRKALEALEKDNFHDDLPQSGRGVSDFRQQSNKKLQQRFSVVNEADANELNDESGLNQSGLTENTETSRMSKSKLKMITRIASNNPSMI